MLNGGFKSNLQRKMTTMENLINRIRQSICLGLNISEIHEMFVVDGEVSEEDFFLAWQAASILDNP
jgi:hypothetical protein